MDYFDHGTRRRGNTVQQEGGNPSRPTVGGARGSLPHGVSLESLRAPSSIRIRRYPSGQVPQVGRPTSSQAPTPAAVEDAEVAGRRRSLSAPQHYAHNLGPPTQHELARQRTHDGPSSSQMPTITEGQRIAGRPVEPNIREEVETPGAYDSMPPTPAASEYLPHGAASRVTSNAEAMQEAGEAARRNRGLRRFVSSNSMSRRETINDHEYTSDMVDLLDLVDPEVRTLGTLTNVQNSLFVPDLGRLINRRPTYDLSRRPTSQSGRPPTSGSAAAEMIGRSRAGTAATRPDLPVPREQPLREEAAEEGIELQSMPERRMSISSNLSESRYAVLPHGVSLEGWSEEDKEELNDHVRHMLHSRREGFKRSMRGFRQYISRPLGLFVFVYATLVTLFGAAWVLFLIGWIYVGPRKSYITNVVDNILVALFALMGDGLAPFRVVDTYHMCFIARYHHLTWKLRKQRNLPELADHNDLPDRRASLPDLEDAIDKEETAEISVLKPLQQKRLQYHQAKFSKAHTFYRPHETATHHAFPLRLLVGVVVLLDFHSLFQVALGTCTWSWDYRTRPEALTATILSCSITCNIVAGVLISIGDHRTRKKDVLERIFRQTLTEEALGRMAERRASNDRLVTGSIEPQMNALTPEPETGAPHIPQKSRSLVRKKMFKKQQ